jgi:TRAP-type mannitol/chloroaromatic compound transport system permease large subunit
MERELIGILSVIVMVVLLLARMPVAFVMLVLGMAGIGWIKGSAAALGAASSIMYGTFASYALVVVPLFTWMGYIGYHSGISEHLYDAPGITRDEETGLQSLSGHSQYRGLGHPGSADSA